MLADFPEEHLHYARDSVRTAAYRAALRSVLRGGEVVLDLGCGVGVLGLLCVEAGASSVTVLDSLPVALTAGEVLGHVTRSDLVQVVQAESRHASFQHRFDLIVCDHVGYFGFDYGIIDLLADARRRFLAPSGRIVPGAINLYLAPVQDERNRTVVDGFMAPDLPPALGTLRRYAVNRKYAAKLAPEAVLGPPVWVGRIDFHADDPHVLTLEADLRIEKPGRLDGIAGWFDCELTESVRMTNSPLAAGRIDRPQAFFPIAEPLDVTPGDTVAARIIARPGDQVIAWTVHHHPSGRRFRHSTVDGMIATETDFRRRRPDHRPTLSAKAQARATVLGYCDGTRSRAEIEGAVMADHPGLFPTPEAIRRFVADVLDRDTE